MPKEPTQEQRNVLEYQGNAVITARPGSGKTYTVVEKIAQILDPLPDFKGVIAISFTNKASDELKSRCKRKGVKTKQSFFGTIDRFYISQIIIPFACHLTYTTPEYTVVSNIDELPQYASLLTLSSKVNDTEAALLIQALSEGYIFLQKSGEIAQYILKNVPGALRYIQARYSHIFIDEYQDCGAIQHDIFLMMTAAGLTGVAVGDIDQAIYGFAQRFPKYLISLVSNEAFRHFKLSKNHRCHPSISEYSLCLYGASKNIPEEKRVFRVHVSGNECDIAKRIDEELSSIKATYDITNNNQVAILCRSNSTISILHENLKTAHKVFIETPLDNDNTEWGRLFRDTLSACFDPEQYAVDYAESLFSEENESDKYRKALALCATIFAREVNTIHTAENAFIELASLVYPKKDSDTAKANLHTVIYDSSLVGSYIPAKKDELNVLTLHKSKGLEFNIVFHMDLYQYIVSDDWGDDEGKTQMLNLHYVGVTRAIDACYLITGTKRYRGRQRDFYTAYPSNFLNRPGMAERRLDIQW